MTAREILRVKGYVEHMPGEIVRIQTYVEELDQAAFTGNTLVQDAVIRNFEIIGEAANKIQLAAPSVVQRHPHLRLDLAYRMRNALIHGYDAVNLTTIWNTIKDDLPALKQRLTAVLGDNAASDD